MYRVLPVMLAVIMLIVHVTAAREGGTVFKEDFTKYDIGDPITDWGTTDVIVLKTADDKTWIQSQTPGLHRAEKRLRLPDNYVLEFQYISERNSFEVIFIDNNESPHVLTFTEGRNYNDIDIKFQDTIVNRLHEMHPRTAHAVKIVKRNKTFRLFVNDRFVLSSTPGGFGMTRGLAFRIAPTTKIGYIEIRELVAD
jgi:hypothetical protein